jgi:hypothetical protein
MAQTREPQPTKEPTDLQVDTSGPDQGPVPTEEAKRTDRGHRMITRLLQVAYPHDSLPDGPYERTATAVQEAALAEAGDERALQLGLDGLDLAAGGDFLSADDATAEQLLRDRADDYFFRFVRSVAVVALYDDHEVWGVLGYEGASFDQGGYLHRGFDDLDWLPDPRIEEYDGEPRVELVTDEGESA